MKKVLKIIFGVIGFVYILVAIFAIACLLKKNDFGYPQFGNKTLFVIEEDNKDTGFNKGDLVILNKPKNDDVKINDIVFFYETEYAKNTVNVGKVTNREVINEKETTFTVAGKAFSSEFLIGDANGSTRYANIGSFVNTLLSRWGFFGIIIVPFFIMFVVELLAIYAEIKYGKKAAKENN